MLGDRLNFLLSIASPSVSTGDVRNLPSSGRGLELGEILLARNGFYMFESAFLIRGSGTSAADLDYWNAADTWRGRFPDTAGMFFFAEDIFGSQFAILEDAIVRFDPETGRSTESAGSFEEFADQILTDYNYLTGYPLAMAWQQEHGPLPAGQRLVPKLPFVLGGAYELENLHAVRDVDGMIDRSILARQIHHLPDGTKLKVEWAQE